MATLLPGQPVPPAVAWPALAACGVAALLGGFSMQAHLLAAPDLGGALGLSADEASWVPTAGAMAEGAAVLVAAPLTGAFGVRRVVAGAAIATGCLAVTALAAPTALVPVRFAQGFACGLLPVVMMTFAMRAFAPGARGLPLMLFAFASSAPSAVAALATGLATSHWGGTGVFLVDLLWTPLVALLALTVLPHEPVQAGRLVGIDWPGYALLSCATMLIVLVLQQGERRFWLETAWVAPLAAAGVALLALTSARLLTAASPYLDLSLLAKPTFAVGMAEALSLRFGLLMASFAVPQALARLQGFRPEQAGEAVLWLGVGQLAGFPLAWLWLKRRDGRVALALGLAAFALAAAFASRIDPSWQGDQFAGPMLLAGFGQGFFLTSVVTFATWDVPAAAGATAAGLFNLTRVLGTSAASAAVAYGVRVRENGHSARLVEGIAGASEAAAARLDDLARTYRTLIPDAGAVQSASLTALASEASRQAYALAFGDVFLAIAAVLAGFALLVPLLPRIPASPEPVRPEAT
ncbi:MFS transporter [Methylobacterium sp. JK268]